MIALTGLQVQVEAAEIDERRLPGESPKAMTQRLALAKARVVSVDSGLVLGADTVVVDGEQVLGKPKDLDDARRMLESLRGREHKVVTSIVLLAPEGYVLDTCESPVPMRDYSDAELEVYLASGKPFDKAGSYAIQDMDFEPVDVSKMQHCYANVMGLPLCHVTRDLPNAPPADVPAACQAHTGYSCPIYQEVLEGQH